MKLSEKLIKKCESLSSDSDLEKTRDDVEKIKSKLNDLKIKIKKESDLGKSASFLDNLKKEWDKLQDQVVSIWQSYDSKHGTKYAKHY